MGIGDTALLIFVGLVIVLLVIGALALAVRFLRRRR